MLAARIIILLLGIYLFGLNNFSLGSEKATMEIGVLLESAEKGIFLEYEVQLLED